jgi:crossover junction endodeoxyribonuclease RuvC
MRVLGIDPGSTATGFGVVERKSGNLVHAAHGTLRPPAGGNLPVRLDHLYRAIREVIELHEPDCVSVEDVFVAASPRAALVLGQARGAILAAVAGAGLPVNEYAPARIKRSVAGNGRATKSQMKTVVKRLLGLDRLPGADAADALAAAICHLHAGRLEALGVIRRPARRRVTDASARFAARRPR